MSAAVYSQKFRECVAFVLKEEAGFVNDPHDPGGATKFGISIRSCKREIGDLDGDGDIDADDVKILPVERAIEIYHDREWQEIRGEELDPPLALIMLDTAVNCGPDRAIKLLQHAGGLAEDGQFGPKTIEFAQRDPLAPSSVLVARRSFYRGLKNFDRYGKGWIARVIRLDARAGALVRAQIEALAAASKAPGKATV